MKDQDSSGRSYGLPSGYDRVGFCLRMFPDCSLPITAETSESSCPRWMTSGTVWRGACWMHSTSESPNVAVGSSLSDILEPRVQPKFYLSPRACRGILRRAEKRGRELPEALRRALTAVATTEDSDPSRESTSSVSRDATPKTAGGVVTDLRAGNPHPSVVIAPLTTKPYADNEAQESRIVIHALTGEGHDAGEDGTGRGMPTVAQCQGSNVGQMGTLRKGNGNVTGGVPFVAFDTTQITSPLSRANPKPDDPCHTLAGGAHPPPRRLTPTECERLQGFPDDWTDVRYQHGKGEKQLSDSSRYRLLGNSMAVPCVGWILERLVRIS